MGEKKYMDEEATVEVEGLMEVLTKVDLDLAFSSEKLVNLNGLLMQLSAEESEHEANVDKASPEFMEKALVFNLLSGVLDSEVREMDSFMVSLEAGIVDAHRNISSCRHYAVLGEKLSDSEESLKQTRYQVSELKTQSAKLQRTAQALAHGKCETEEVSGDDLSSNLNGQADVRIAGHRHILHMLEKSLARELDLEKKLSERRKREDELRIKLRYSDQLALRMEEEAQVLWERFLEAVLSSVVLEGISHDLLSQFQRFQFDFNSMSRREAELKSKYEYCQEELKLKDMALETLKIGGLGNSSNEAELAGFREKVKFLEEKFKESEFQLRNANSINESSQIRITELENLVDSLRESIDIADTRAVSAELKVAELIGTNVELTEELNFLKESVGNTEKKVGALEKQLREADIQLQHAKASSEASQEQQTMLYSAIWDMETLIEDLKSKVTRAENKNESTEENCIALSETNAELTNEISVLRDKIEDLEARLEEANSEKIASANEVDARVKLIMDLVGHLGTERERIQKQFNTLTKENENFAKRLGFKAQNGSVGQENNGKEKENDDDDDDDEEPHSSLNNGLINSSRVQSSFDAMIDSAGKSCQSNEALEEEPPLDDGAHNPTYVNTGNRVVSRLEGSNVVSPRFCTNLKFVCVAIFVSLLSVLVMYFINHKQHPF